MTNTQDSAKERPIVYVRKVAVEDLPQDVQDRAGGLQSLYAIGDENGERIALVRNREMAFVVARQNHMHPMSVH